MIETERERDKGLSSSQIKRRAGLAAITLLIGPHLFCLVGRWKWTGRNVPAGNETIYIPSAFLLSATHNLSLSHTLSNTHSPSGLSSASTSFLHLPPSSFLSVFVFPGGYLAYCFLSSSSSHLRIFLSPSTVSVSLLYPAMFFSFGISLHLYSVACLHSLVSSFSIIAHDRIPYILVCFSGSLGVPLLCYSSYRPTHQMLADLCLQSAHPLMHVVFKNNKTKTKAKLAPYGIFRGVIAQSKYCLLGCSLAVSTL